MCAYIHKRNIEQEMKSFVGYILVAATVVIMVACSVVNQAIKSNDPQYAYEQALMLYEKGKWNQASSLFEACRHVYQASPREDSLAYYNAHCKFKEHKWDEASTLLDDHRRRFGRSPFAEDVEGMYALCYYYMSPSPERDQTVTTQAIVAITEFMSRYPESMYSVEFSDMLQELMDRLMEKSYLNAYTYYKIGRYKSAIVAFKNAIRQFPDSPRVEDMRYYTTVSAYKLAANSVTEKQLDRYLDMLDHYYTFIAEYPESTSRIKELERMAKDARNFIDKNRKTSDAQ